MFSQGKSPLPGAAGFWLTTVKSSSNGRTLDVGDEFEASSHADTYHLTITGCSQSEYLAYEIIANTAGVFRRMEISLTRVPGRLIFNAGLTVRFQRISFLALLSNVFYLGRPAARELRALLSTEGRSGTSYWGAWTSLPIDYASVVVD